MSNEMQAQWDSFLAEALPSAKLSPASISICRLCFYSGAAAMHCVASELAQNSNEEEAARNLQGVAEEIVACVEVAGETD